MFISVINIFYPVLFFIYIYPHTFRISLPNLYMSYIAIIIKKKNILYTIYILEYIYLYE